MKRLRTYAETLIFPAGENCREEVPNNEKQQKDVMQLVMALGIKNTQQNQTSSTQQGKQNRQNGQRLFAARGIGDQAALVAQPALGDKGQVEGDGDDAGAGDEERLELGGSNVAYVDNVGVGGHEAVGLLVLVHDPVEEHAEEHA